MLAQINFSYEYYTRRQVFISVAVAAEATFLLTASMGQHVSTRNMTVETQRAEVAHVLPSNEEMVRDMLSHD